MLKTGKDTRNSFHHVAVSGHPVVANIRVPSWVDWNRYRVAIRRLCRDPRRGVPRTPVIGTGMGGACGQLQSSAPQTGRHKDSRCYPSDECSFHVAGSFSPGPLLREYALATASFHRAYSLFSCAVQVDTACAGTDPKVHVSASQILKRCTCVAREPPIRANCGAVTVAAVFGVRATPARSRHRQQSFADRAKIAALIPEPCGAQCRCAINHG